MTTETTYDSPRKPLPRWIVPSGAAVLALVAGLAIGASTTGGANSSCVEALDAADEAIGVFGAVMFDVAAGFDAVADFNWRGVDAMTAKISAHSDTIEGITPVYTQASAECRTA